MIKHIIISLSILALTFYSNAQEKPLPKLAKGFKATIYASPKQGVNYPECLSAAPTGELYIGVDKDGSLGKTHLNKKGMGYVLKCIDNDNDGKVDKVIRFATMDHPRGIFFDDNKLWCLYPPKMSLFIDEDRDGKSDKEVLLIDGISTEFVNKRGADHTTNGIRKGIDGWLYIAVGDFGFLNAKTPADGKSLTLKGGGVARIRPDGTELEIYCRGTRNIMDVNIDPYLNIYTRDNTNDGGHWNVRVTHITQSANYGYPSLFEHFTDEIMPTMKDFGGGSGCGGMFLHEPGYPKPYNNALLTCDWGTQKVYLNKVIPTGATFKIGEQSVFCDIKRPTDIDVDGLGNLYVSSWDGAKFKFGGDQHGYVVQIRPEGHKATPFPNLKKASDADLLKYITSRSAVWRQHVQLELIRRGPNSVRHAGLIKICENKSIADYAKIAALFALKQMEGEKSHPALLKLVKHDDIREWVLRALTDRKSQLSNVPIGPFVAALTDKNPRVQAQALISLGRLGNKDAASSIIPLTQMADSDRVIAKDSGKGRGASTAAHAQGLTGKWIPHLAVQALKDMQAYEACLATLDSPESPHKVGALWAMRYMHNKEAVTGLISRIKKTDDKTLKHEMLTTLIRLTNTEKAYDGSWWGTRPDRHGPYYHNAAWDQTASISAAVKSFSDSASPETKAHISTQLTRCRVKIDGIALAAVSKGPKEKNVDVTKVIKKGKKGQIGKMKYEDILAQTMKAKGNVKKGKQLFMSQACFACHTTAGGQALKGPHLQTVATKYKKNELIEAIVKPNASLSQGFATFVITTKKGKTYQGFISAEGAEDLEIRTIAGQKYTILKPDIKTRKELHKSSMPEGLVNNLKPNDLASLIAYLQSLK